MTDSAHANRQLARIAALNLQAAEILELPTVELSDPCTFKCDGCGWKCCTNRTDIRFTPYELTRMVWWMQELIDDYPEFTRPLRRLQARSVSVGTGRNSHLPIAGPIFQCVGSYTRCPFLVPANSIRDNTPAVIAALERAREGIANAPMAVCAIHPVRPNVCRLYPLGRIGIVGIDGEITKWSYRLQPIDCGQRISRDVTWGEWIDQDEQRWSSKGMQIYKDMCDLVVAKLTDAGVDVDAWLLDARHQGVLAMLFYALPCMIPERGERTRKTAIVHCEASSDVLRRVVDTILTGKRPEKQQMLEMYHQCVA